VSGVSFLAGATMLAITGGVLACSPEAHRTRDGGPGADPGNKVLVAWPPENPKAADTTLWPGRNPAPVVRLASGSMPPPVPVSSAPSPGTSSARPVTPSVPATRSDQRTYQKGTTANPRRPSSPPPRD
jgi:hypothetical protein